MSMYIRSHLYSNVVCSPSYMTHLSSSSSQIHWLDVEPTNGMIGGYSAQRFRCQASLIKYFILVYFKMRNKL